jgi:NAD+ synthase (glutamine-hydrolysing)
MEHMAIGRHSPWHVDDRFQSYSDVECPDGVMRLVKIAVASTNPSVGATRSNSETLLRLARAMATDDVTIGCFPEQAIGGYPAEDLVQWHDFIDAQWTALERFAAGTADHGTVYVVGLVVDAAGGQLFNVAAVVHRGRILGLVPKEELPTYSVFYERRTFSRGAAGFRTIARGVPLGDYIFAFDAFTLAVEVCEDGWSPDGPMRRRSYSGADVVANISSSPFRVGVQNTRREMLATRSADNQVTLAYATRVGGQDGLVFDGGGFVFQNGRLVVEAPRFRKHMTTSVVDLHRTSRLRLENTTWRTDWEHFRDSAPFVSTISATAPSADRSKLRYPAPVGGSFFLPPATPQAESPGSTRDDTLDELFEAVALGLKDYAAKTPGVQAIGIALSGGRDSLLTLLVAWRARQLLAEDGDGRDGAAPDRPISAFYLPSRYSGAASHAAAVQICADLGLPLHTSSIDDALDREARATTDMLEDRAPSALTLQNVQARLRGMRMWNWANSAGALFLQTSDMSEKAVGYVTVGGDLEGALSVIANLPKTVVVALLERLYARFHFDGIRLALATAPSPELAPGQAAESELMPFPVLDACLHLYAGEKLGLDDIVAALPGLFPALPAEDLRAWATRFVELFTRSIFKWVQAPLSLHVGTLDLERERALQLPVLQRDEWAKSTTDRSPP